MTHPPIAKEQLFALLDDLNRKRAEHVAQGGAENGIPRGLLSEQSTNKRKAYHAALKALLESGVDYEEDRWCEVKLAPRIPVYFVPAEELLRALYLAHVRALAEQAT